MPISDNLAEMFRVEKYHAVLLRKVTRAYKEILEIDTQTLASQG